MKISSFVFLFLVLPMAGIFAQTDTLVMSNKDMILGEVKSMDKGILVFETDYSNVNFKIDWLKIRQIHSQTKFMITLSNGVRYTGRLKSLNDSIVAIDTQMPELNRELSEIDPKTESLPEPRVQVPFNSIVYLNALEEGFWSRLSLNFDIGTNITKANDLRQYTFNLGMGYLADRWKANLTFNNLRSTQRESAPIKRTELTFAYNFFLQNDWYLLYNLNMLTNTEQLLILRNSNMLGAGKYLVHTNRVYLGFQGGFNLNSEKFQNQESSSQSAEAFIGAGYNIYDIGDLDLLTSLVVYPSLSNQGRIRSDFKFDLRYEFKFDLYFKVGTTLNYDNQPTEGATSLDYLFQTTLGWKL